MIGPQFYALLTGDSAVSAIIGTRVYPPVLPQAPTFPAVTYQIITERREYAMGNHSNLTEARVQFDAYASTYDSVVALAKVLRARIESFSGQIGTPPVVIQRAFQVSGSDAFEVGTEKAGPRLWRRTLDFTFWYEDV